MLDETSQALLDWAAGVSGDLQAGLTMLVDPPETPRVSICLIDFEDHPPMRGNGRTPLQFIARYLVAVHAMDPIHAHRILGELIFAAMENPAFEVNLDAVDPDYWSALGVPPQPAFTLKVPVRRTRSAAHAPMVRQPISVQSAPIRVIEGIVTAPGNVPLPNIHVELAGQGNAAGATRASTDRSGRFALTVGPLAGDQQLRISSSNHSMTTTLNDSIDEDGVVRVQFDPFAHHDN